MVSADRRQAQLEKLCTVLIETLADAQKAEAEAMLEAADDALQKAYTKVDLELEALEKVPRDGPPLFNL